MPSTRKLRTTSTHQQIPASSSFERKHAPSSVLSETKTQTQRHILKRDAHSKKAQGVHTTTKIERKTCAHPFHLLFPLTTTLSLAVTARPMRDKSTHAVTAGLSVATSTTRPHAFSGTACPGPCGSSRPPLPTPYPSRKARSCHQAHTTR